MSKTDTWMALYIGDYLADTLRLTTLQHGAYLLLLMEYWRQGPLPDDDNQLAAIAKMNVREWKKDARSAVRRFFHLGDDGLLHQRRADIERGKTAGISATRSGAGKNGAAKRWGNHSKTDGKKIANAMASALQSDAHIQSQIQIEHNPPIIPLSLTPDVAPATPPRGGVKKSRARTRLPDDWRPSEDGIALAAREGLPFERTLARFHAHHTAKGTLMASWNGAWATWCLSPWNQPQGIAADKGTQRRSSADANQRRIDELTRQATGSPQPDDFFGTTIDGVTQ